MTILEQFRQGDRRALSRIITHVENRRSNYRELLAEVSRQERKAYRIGITGPPGAGKSTLVDAIITRYARQDLKIGVIAVDPSSPFTGGALLGDRVRMQHLANMENVFVRSMASRGQTGGIAAATRDVVRVLDAFGMDLILIETVGIGQIELDIVEACDTVVVILVPESGDMIQTMKAGLMEIADVFCVNKIDRAGGERLLGILNTMIHERLGEDDEEIQAVGTNGVTGDGVDLLLDKIAQHRRIITDNGEFEARRKRQLKSEIIFTVRDRVARDLDKLLDFDAEFESMSERLLTGETDPYSVADEIYEHYFRGRLVNG